MLSGRACCRGTGSLKQKFAPRAPLPELLIDHLRPPKAKNRRGVARKQRLLLLSTSILRIRQRACPWSRRVLLQIRGHLFFNGIMVSDFDKQEWDAVFSSVSKLKRGNKQTGK